ncbi:hypothetical protein B0H11DRAFT_2403622 [Mycena galericulata]|nr:hypothetical protein B0H11DRAFT_2403622 [Mycena galericulata]
MVFVGGATQVYWLGSGAVFLTDPELLEIGDDVAFGLRSGIFMSDRLGTAKVIIGDGGAPSFFVFPHPSHPVLSLRLTMCKAKIADRVVFLPGARIGKMMATGSVPLALLDTEYKGQVDVAWARCLPTPPMEDGNILCEHLRSHRSTPACDHLPQPILACTAPYGASLPPRYRLRGPRGIRDPGAHTALFSHSTPPPATPSDGSALRAMQFAASPAYYPASSTCEPRNPTESTTLAAGDDGAAPSAYNIRDLPPAGVGWREAE